MDVTTPWHFNPERVCADGQTHLQWAKKVARGVARYFGFRGGSQETEDIVSTAYLHLLRKAARFEVGRVPAGGDIDMQFRGWAHPSIRAECLREARRLRTGEPFAFAGLWGSWRAEGVSPLVTTCLITTAADELVSEVHDRMPVILPRENYAEWLDTETPMERLLELLKPYPAGAMQVTAANPVVNSPKIDGPECLEAA